MSKLTWERLPLEEQNRIRAVAASIKAESMGHVGRLLLDALTPFPSEGGVTIDIGWLREFADNCVTTSHPVTVHTDYIFERAISALDDWPDGSEQ